LVIIAFTYRNTANVRNIELRALTVWLIGSGDNSLLPEGDFGFYMPAIRAIELMDSKIAASCVRLDGGQPLRLAALRAGIVHKKDQKTG
jgi:hypothetical protein